MIGYHLSVHELAAERTRFPDADLAADFHAAGIFLPGEREEYEARIEAEAVEEDRARDRRRRRESAVCLTLAGLSVLLATGGIAYSYGRSREATLTLQAYSSALHATALLRDYIPVAEGALATCVGARDELASVLGRVTE